MGEILKKQIELCIEQINEDVLAERIRKRNDAIAFAMGWFSDMEVVPIKVLAFINELYYQGQIGA